MSDLGHAVDLDCGFDAAVDRVTKELAAEGFSVVSRIDLDKAFPERLGIGFRRFSILGACNPQLAHQAITATPEVGLMLPCNVTVEEIDGRTCVRIVDVNEVLGVGGLEEMPEVAGLADDAGARLGRVAAALTVRAL